MQIFRTKQMVEFLASGNITYTRVVITSVNQGVSFISYDACGRRHTVPISRLTKIREVCRICGERIPELAMYCHNHRYDVEDLMYPPALESQIQECNSRFVQTKPGYVTNINREIRKYLRSISTTEFNLTESERQYAKDTLKLVHELLIDRHGGDPSELNFS